MALDPLELVIRGIIVVVVIVMGPTKIPQLARALGMARKEFTEASKSPPAVAATSPQMGEDDLMVAAKRLGISTEGKTREQISAEIVRKTAGA